VPLNLSSSLARNGFEQRGGAGLATHCAAPGEKFLLAKQALPPVLSFG